MPDLDQFGWWATLPFRISPYLFEVNGFAIRYYSLMYILAFMTFYFLVRYRLKTEDFNISQEQIDEFLTWALCGVLLGGRLGYVLFYNFYYFLHHPLEIFLPFTFENGFSFTGISGMSYHGGLIGVALCSIWFCRKNKIQLWEFSDLICPAVPLGYTFGRLGNFINSELYGRITDVPWAMIFPTDPQLALRHPSQLYEAFFEGILLFVILWGLRKLNQLKYMMCGLYLIGYGVMRFFIEFVRMPDAHLNFVFLRFTMGQILCLIMAASGLCLLIAVKAAYRQNKTDEL